MKLVTLGILLTIKEIVLRNPLKTSIQDVMSSKMEYVLNVHLDSTLVGQEDVD